MNTKMENWDGAERRTTFAVAEAETFNLIMETRVAVEEHKQEMHKQFQDIKEELDHHANRVEKLSESTLTVIEKQNSLIKEIRDAFTKAFPEGDAESHRKAHEAWIEKDKADQEFWLKLKQNTINWIVIAILSWVGLVVWGAFVQGPGGK